MEEGEKLRLHIESKKRCSKGAVSSEIENNLARCFSHTKVGVSHVVGDTPKRSILDDVQAVHVAGAAAVITQGCTINSEAMSQSLVCQDERKGTNIPAKYSKRNSRVPTGSTP